MDGAFPFRRTADAFAAFYDAHAPAVYGLCLRILGRPDEAEDALQESFLQVWRQADRYNPASGSPGAWLTVIARSRCLDRLRRRKVRQATEAPLELENADGERSERPVASPETPALDALVTEESRARARAALAALPADQRAALEAAYYDGLTQAEIADKLGAPLGTIKTRMRLGLKKLAEALT